MSAGIKSSFQHTILQAFPSLLAVVLAEIVNIELYLNSPIKDAPTMILLWSVIQIFPGFIFALISDKNYRKFTLVLTQFLGALGGILMLIFGYELWVFLLIAFIFNPLPVARAAFLDNFPHVSRIKIISITYIAQQLPWVYFYNFSKVADHYILYAILIGLGINTLLTHFFLNDHYDKHEKTTPQNNKFSIVKKNPTLDFAIIAFIIAEISFYMLWGYLENTPQDYKWLSMTTANTVIGIVLTIFYTRMPHMSAISLFYVIGAAISIGSIYMSIEFPSLSDTNLVSSMSHYSLIGGMYLVFVTDAVIHFVGSKKKAVGSFLVEASDTVATLFAPLLLAFVKLNSFHILTVVSSLFFIAFIVQKIAEKEHRKWHI